MITELLNEPGFLSRTVLLVAVVFVLITVMGIEKTVRNISLHQQRYQDSLDRLNNRIREETARADLAVRERNKAKLQMLHFQRAYTDLINEKRQDMGLEPVAESNEDAHRAFLEEIANAG